MNKDDDRVLAYRVAKKITDKELEKISGGSKQGKIHRSMIVSQQGMDTHFDRSSDL